MGKIKVVIKTVDGVFEEKTIENTIGAMQKIVGGYVEMVSLAHDLCVLCNEDGIIDGLKKNVNIAGFDFRGNLIFCDTHGDGFADCAYSAEEIEKIIKRI